MKKNNKNNIIKYVLFIIILIIICAFILFYNVNTNNINVQKYLNKVYINRELLIKKYGNFTNKNIRIKNDNNIIIVEDFLNKDFFMYLQKQFDNKVYKSRNFHIRKATSYNFLNLHENEEYNGLLELYYSNEMLDSLSNILQKPIQRTPLNDNNACSLLIYTNKGDYITWHKDSSIYNGDRYVVLITLINENSDKNDLSHNEFVYIHNKKEYSIKMKPNSMVLFKGSEILHKSTEIEDKERRILLSMVFCDICHAKNNIFNKINEKLKNFVLYGK